MKNQLTDLDELLFDVKNNNSKEYLREAIISYRAGAYRAAITSTWIAICVDVIQKILELANAGDLEAVKLEARLHGINPNDVSSMLTFEKDILRIAQEDLEIISLIERNQLERIQLDRNICAHPTFSPDGIQFIPKSELARAYIVMAGDYLLCVNPVKGKIILDTIFNFINSNSFPEDEAKIFETLKSDFYLGRVKESVYRNLFILILKRIFRNDELVSEELLKKMTYTLSAIEKLNNGIYNIVSKEKFIPLITDASDVNFERLYIILYYKPELWNLTDSAIKNRLEQLLKSMNEDELVKNKIGSLVDSIQNIRNSFIERVKNTPENEIHSLCKKLPCIALVDSAINIFIHSYTFSDAYTNGLMLLVFNKYFNDENLKSIFEGTMNNSNFGGINQIVWASEIINIFLNMYRGTKNNRVINHTELWIDFRNKLLDMEFVTSKLDELILLDGHALVNKEE